MISLKCKTAGHQIRIQPKGFQICISTTIISDVLKTSKYDVVTDKNNTSLFSEFESIGSNAPILKLHKAPMLLASIGRTCCLGSKAAALRTKGLAELAWDYFETAL